MLGVHMSDNELRIFIKNATKNEFRHFLELDDTFEVARFFAPENILAFPVNHLREERMSYILSFSQYCDELCKLDAFLNVLTNSDVSRYYAVLRNLSHESLKNIVAYGLENHKDYEIYNYVLPYISSDSLIKMLDEFSFPMEVIIDILANNHNISVINKIFSKYHIDLSNCPKEIPVIFANFKDLIINDYYKKEEKIDLILPPNFISEELAAPIYSEYSIIQTRQIINDIDYFADSTVINDFVKKEENKFISYLSFNELIPLYEEIYNLYEKALNGSNIDAKKLNDIFLKNAKDSLKQVYDAIVKRLDLNQLKQILLFETEKKLAEYIIDYHFEENFYNINIDLEELLKFYYAGNITLSLERAALYERIYNIDYLSREEKIYLHEDLKRVNIKERFYDDMAFARKIVREAIKDASLTYDELKKYENKKLSEKYGVKVYEIADEPFFALVKSYEHTENSLPAGYSYSLIGNGGLAVFASGLDDPTYVYDAKDLVQSQIVHVFPCDSFTYYHPHLTSDLPSNRVNALMMPDELVEFSESYNEILILEKGITPTDRDKNIPRLKQIALYCIDEISERNVEEARVKGIGILLVNSKKCKINDSKQSVFYRHSPENFFEKDYYDAHLYKEAFDNLRPKV